MSLDVISTLTKSIDLTKADVACPLSLSTQGTAKNFSCQKCIDSAE